MEEPMKFDDQKDFGFTFMHENEIVVSDLESLKIRLRTLRAVFLPLLEHLSREPDKEMIKWPNRKGVIDAQIKRLKELTEV